MSIPVSSGTLLTSSGTLQEGKEINQKVFTFTGTSLKKLNTLSTITTLKKGTSVTVYRTLPNGKSLKVGTARVINGKIRYVAKGTGTYTFQAP